MNENLNANDVVDSLKKQIADLCVAVAYRDATIKSKEDTINNLYNEIGQLKNENQELKENKKNTSEKVVEVQ